MKLEDLEIYALPEGTFAVGEDKVFYPHEIDTPIPTGKLLVAVNPFLIKTPEDIILIDTGLGEMAEDHDISTLIGHLDHFGVKRGEVTKVLLSHLHFDHVGAAICSADANDGLPFPTFPNATYYAQSRELKSNYGKRSNDARNHIVAVLENHGAIEWLNEDEGWIDDRIQYRVSKGHTEFHMVFYIWTNGKCAVYGGDELPQPTQINRKFFAKYDYDPKEAQREREFISKEALVNEQLLLFYHSTSAPAAFLTAFDEKLGYTIVPMGADEVETKVKRVKKIQEEAKVDVELTAKQLETIFYSLNYEDIQTVAQETLNRNLSLSEIKKIIPEIEKQIDWHNAISVAIASLPTSENNA